MSHQEPDQGDDAMTEANPKQAIDWIEVGRVAHELELRHGRNAPSFAAKLADQAERDGQISGAVFWRSVSAALSPRDAGVER
jgi:hypothetical protein